MKPQFENSTEYSKDRVFEAAWKYYRLRYKRSFILQVGQGVLFMGLSLFMGIGLNSIPLAIPWMFFMTFNLLQPYFRTRKIAKRVYETAKNYENDGTVHYAFYDNHFTVTDHLDTVRVEWIDIIKGGQTKTCCILVAKKGFYILDIEGFTTGDAEGFMRYANHWLLRKNAEAA